MASRAVPFALLVAAIGFLGAAVVPAWAEDADPAATGKQKYSASIGICGYRS